ncbi:hypothetical protein OG982_30080 [Streptomyces sp. NBC_01551]|uniref:hypothetical protein n=1 Tax=Streptomyces sp. NBC_01551 TaxID=2975876 RepID=UPI00225A228C|nr:hypothetical protein [Streptomyces sp. NBC_01551]MCX4529893.1 hypothetical protein [Streptomyces sp. NBC_01551]
MSLLIDTANQFAILADDPPIVPDFKPAVPGPIKDATSTILGWTAGSGLALAVLGGLVGWACVAIGHNTERAGLAARGKQAIIWSLVAGMGIGVTSGLVMAFYNMSKSGGA